MKQKLQRPVFYNQAVFVHALCGLWMVLLAIGASSCRQQPKGTFTVTGQLWDSCGGNPVAGQLLNVSGITYGFNSKRHRELGSATTDANGNFSIVCEDYSATDLRLEAGNAGMDLDVTSLGPIYMRSHRGVRIQVSVTGNIQPGDSLYIAPLYSPEPQVYALNVPVAATFTEQNPYSWVHAVQPNYPQTALYTFSRHAYDSLTTRLSTYGSDSAQQYPLLRFRFGDWCQMRDTAVTIVKP